MNTSLLVGIHELPRRAGEHKQLHRICDAPPDLGVEMIGVRTGDPVNLDLTLQSAGEGVWVTGTAVAELHGHCVRCLSDITYSDSFNIAELYYYPGREADEEANYVVNDEIDLDPALRAAVILELPINPLCTPDCLGLCPICGLNLNESPEHSHTDTPPDDRWERLKSDLNLNQ
ncbi:MAG: DUF177 domain-containing protein [Propionibacteriaceae bacterium]|jgi:uncharacterized protein|nr:DUF177 domain-containing protein [Propionibacteriaceae bacterium]